MEQLGLSIGRKLAAATGPTELFIPLAGVSAVDVEGAPFRDAEADSLLFAALRRELEGSDVRLHELDMAINDKGFGAAMADALHAAIFAR